MDNVTRVLAFDVGKSGCRAALFVDGLRVDEAETSGARGLADPGGLESALAAMRSAADAVDGGRVDAVAAGVAGYARADDTGAELVNVLAERHHTCRVAVASDMTTSHAGSLAGRPGVVVAAGTGSVALAVAATGMTAVVDGWGYLLGDNGSGFAIGRRGLRSALRAHDGRGGSEVLRALAERRYGDLDRLPQLVHGASNPPRIVAAFARDVVGAARDGDEWSSTVCAESGAELARTAIAAAMRAMPDVQTLEISTSGGLFDAGDLLTGPFATEAARLLPGSRLVPRAGDARDGGLLMATRDDLPHETLIRRYEGART
ncbi:N-acetylglucosamine kinase [Rhodococcus marinonascens]|uniref:N-acetylglucosamine kinase n=1 Tax=Rhodococcus marinonascens TaxID=38311 RepID=UPI0009FEF14B|nr:BadF/BadG/BcrA/BcrD ATPase family protein [Rhodococcus marinonascens]